MDRRRRIVDITLDERSVIRRSPPIEHERAAAIHDLLEDNDFRLAGGPDGPYRLRLGIEDARLIFDVGDDAKVPLARFGLSLRPFRTVVKDYFQVCDSYFKAIRTMTPTQIEAIDMGRRGLHDDGAALLRERLAGKAVIDDETARRLFTLVCVLHIRPWEAP